jgi:hypothetical protein
VSAPHDWSGTGLRSDVTSALETLADEVAAASVFRDMARRVAGALGLLRPRVDPETGEEYDPSWHDMPERVERLRADLAAERAAHAETRARMDAVESVVNGWRAKAESLHRDGERGGGMAAGARQLARALDSRADEIVAAIATLDTDGSASC